MTGTGTIYIKSVTPLWLDIAGHLRQHHGWAPRLWVTADTPAIAQVSDRFPEARIYRHADALRGLWPQAVTCTSRRPVDAAVLGELAAHEPIFYAMIERWSIDAGRITWDAARQYYLSLLRTWLRLIDSLEAEIIVCPTVPHRLYDYVAYLAAKVTGIPFLMVDQTGEFLKSDAGAWGLDFVIWTIGDRTRPFREAALTAGPPSAAARRHLEDGRRDYAIAKPGYFAAKEDALNRALAQRRMVDRIPTGLRLAASYAVKRWAGRGNEPQERLWFPPGATTMDDTPRLATAAQVTRHHRGLIHRAGRALAWYRSHAAPPPAGRRPYVYFAASYQPERNSVPDAGRFHAEETSIALLEAITPEGWEIWYKEHPTNFRPPIRRDNARSVVLYEKLKAISPRLHFAALDADPFALIDGARAVVTTTGTTGWQALVRGVPAIVLGDGWYAGCSEALRVSGPADGRAAMARIIAGFRPDFAGVCRYAAALETVCRDLGFRRDQDVGRLRETDPARYGEHLAAMAAALTAGLAGWRGACGGAVVGARRLAGAQP